MLLMLDTLCRRLLPGVGGFSRFTIRTNSTEALNTFCWRTHTCGELRQEHVGSEVTLCGWVEFRRPKRFLILRDWHGHVQLFLKSGNSKNIALESVVKAVGTVQPRPEKDVNPDMKTGDIEVHVEKLDILNPCEHLPFQIHDFEHKNEDTRMKFRYLDIRTKTMQENLRIRSKLTSSMREFLIHKYGFIEVETPTLFRPTPGGAREFLVPSSTDPGLFYSLPQSPQQFKQLLMVGGIDRYFQVARCYRDEGAKPDRQPEFTQLDIEMSFVSADDVMNITENMIKSCWPNEIGNAPFRRMSLKDAVDKYGTDKPDIRFELTLEDTTDVLKSSGVIQGEDTASCLVIRENYSKFVTEVMAKEAYQRNEAYFAKNLIPNAVFSYQNGDLNTLCGSEISESVINEISAKLDMGETDLIWLCWGDDFQVKTVLGKARLLIADAIEKAGMNLRTNEHKFLWVNDFPLFEYNSEEDLQCVHHPFTAPHPDDISLLETDPVKVRSLAYDLVLNGNEVAGGSIRIHNSSFQRRILNEFLKIDSSQLEHLLQALDSGAPPHGGIALGLDRLIAVLCNANSIRDVIAFPKSYTGRDLMCGAPCKPDKETLSHFFANQNES